MKQWREIFETDLELMDKKNKWQGKSNPTFLKEDRVGVPSIKIRYGTIKVGWLKKMGPPEPDRPDCAWVANEFEFQSAQQKPTLAPPTVKKWVC